MYAQSHRLKETCPVPSPKSNKKLTIFGGEAVVKPTGVFTQAGLVAVLMIVPWLVEICLVIISEQPVTLFETLRVTLYVIDGPPDKHVYGGFWQVEIADPSPKSQDQLVALVELSINVKLFLAPQVDIELKSASGALIVTICEMIYNNHYS